MTYCVGILLDSGLVFASDSRTNAGLDNYLKFCKMTVFERKGDRVIVLLSSGSLAGTQAIISLLTQRGRDPTSTDTIWTARTMFDVAKCVLISFDSTMRSNLSVGMPIDLICYERDSLEVRMRRRFEDGDTYFSSLHQGWSDGIRQIFAELPSPLW